MYFILLILFYISCVWVILLLNFCYICVCINIFVNVISVFTAICLHNLQNIPIACTQSWRSFPCIFPVYSLICLCCHPHWTSFKKVYYHPFVWIYHLFVTWIGTHRFVINLSIFNIVISILKFFCFLLLLGQLFTLNLQHYNTCNQNQIYTIFE